MKLFLLLLLFGIGLATPFSIGSTCKNSFDCFGGIARCCRDANGQAIVQQEGFDIFPPDRTGTCSSVLGKEGDICGNLCGCELGYTCYRPMSGVCCLPKKCYDSEWVKEQELYWANCFPPKCYFPVR